jgi:hypothetical protein
LDQALPPLDYTPRRWQAVVTDARHFLRDWAARAHELGWSELAVFGCHAVKPAARFDAMGLVTALNGLRIVEMFSDRAALEGPHNARLTFYRHEPRVAECEQATIWGVGS